MFIWVQLLDSAWDSLICCFEKTCESGVFSLGIIRYIKRMFIIENDSAFAWETWEKNTGFPILDKEKNLSE